MHAVMLNKPEMGSYHVAGWINITVHAWAMCYEYLHDLPYLSPYGMQEITKVERAKGEPWPQGRFCHAACCLNYGEDHPQLLVFGGVNEQLQVLGDMWILDVDQGKWTEVSILYLNLLYIHNMLILSSLVSYILIFPKEDVAHKSLNLQLYNIIAFTPLCKSPQTMSVQSLLESTYSTSQ